MKRPYRIVVAKPGFEGHDRGATTTTRALHDHGVAEIFSPSSSPDAIDRCLEPALDEYESN